jgi:hypothetical protein
MSSSDINDLNFQINKSYLKKKTKRYQEIWTLEEEYIFFETHLILGNRWNKYSNIIKNK